MKRTFLVDLDITDDTDFIGIAEDLKEHLNATFDYPALDVRVWSSPGETPMVPLGNPSQQQQT